MPSRLEWMEVLLFAKKVYKGCKFKWPLKKKIKEEVCNYSSVANKKSQSCFIQPHADVQRGALK